MLLTFIAGTVVDVRSAWAALFPNQLPVQSVRMFDLLKCWVLAVGCVTGGVLADRVYPLKLKLGARLIISTPHLQHN
jgi:hypothetical protein